KFMPWNFASVRWNPAPLLCEISLLRSAPLRRNFKLRALKLSLNLGRASYKFKARAKFKLEARGILRRCIHSA
ncbi:MAG: hypothetical protein ACFNVQ_03530, partial [Campylobacter sp.]